MALEQTPLKEAIIKTLAFLETQKVDYFLLGGVAVALLGEPRFTKDVDVDVFLSKEKMLSLFEKINKAGFKLDNREMCSRVKQTGTFRMFYKEVGIDFILASTDLEKSALKRRKRTLLYRRKTWIPSPEDLILLKIIPGRPQDLMDAESIVLRHKGKLDQKYMGQWAQKISDEMENFRVWHQLQKILKMD